MHLPANFALPPALTWLMLALLPVVPAAADEPLESCGACHALAPPPALSAPSTARLDEAAPPLWYAGNKYRPEWLVAWLTDPQPVRPAGHPPSRHTVAGDDGDRVDVASLPEHPVLSADAAERAAAALLALRPHDELVAAEDYAPGTVPLRMGTMDFRRFKGCIGCHRDRADTGGVSGPELHRAWQRLQPEYLVSYIRDPRAWDPAATMPPPGLNDQAIHKLVHYLHAVAEE